MKTEEYIGQKFDFVSISMRMSGEQTLQVPFEAGSPMVVSGPTGSGKTFWTYKLLREGLFTETPASIMYCYGVHQPFYETFDLPNLSFFQGLPSCETIEKMNDGKFKIIVLDDLMEKIIKSSDAEDLFTIKCHHFNISVIFLTQNIFAKGKHARTINLNTHVTVLFANRRDESQAMSLGKQLFPGKSKFFMEVYEDATSKPHGYLVCDCHPRSPRELELRTNIFSGEVCVIYIMK